MANQATIQPTTTEQDDKCEEDLDEPVCVCVVYVIAILTLNEAIKNKVSNLCGVMCL